MTGWQPHVDLVRLIEALGEEIVAATDREVRQSCEQDGHSVHAAAKQVKAKISSVAGDPVHPDASLLGAKPTRRRIA